MEKEILTHDQLRILEAINRDSSITDNFYLTGGTALAGFYLKHRLSEDLDFFSEQEFETASISVFFQKNKKKLGVQSVDFQQSFNRNLFFLHLKNEVIKTEFTYFPFPRIDTAQRFKNISLDSIIDIAVNKLFTIYQQTRARDYIDLYFIVKKYHFSIDELVHKAKMKFDWHIDYLQLGTQFTRASDVSDYPRMIEDVSEKEWIDFFVEEAKKMKDKVIK